MPGLCLIDARHDFWPGATRAADSGIVTAPGRPVQGNAEMTKATYLFFVP
jgi:hypothetical protein